MKNGFSLGLVASLMMTACLMTISPCSARTWTGQGGQPIEAEYMSATEDTVTIRRADGQAFRLKLVECSQEDRDFVAQKQAEVVAANTIRAIVRGDVIWKLPSWRSMGWQTTQNSELWTYDDKTAKPVAKVADLPVTYDSNFRKNELNGKFSTSAPVSLVKTDRFIIRGVFRGSVNQDEKSVEQYCAPFSLPPADKNGVIELHTVRFTRLK
ncbi:hypothetical protein [Terrimicrobium sacchariphilum]|nr:hypothetical protein [Terrimicrobium sacchariphilum]